MSHITTPLVEGNVTAKIVERVRGPVVVAIIDTDDDETIYLEIAQARALRDWLEGAL